MGTPPAAQTSDGRRRARRAQSCTLRPDLRASLLKRRPAPARPMRAVGFTLRMTSTSPSPSAGQPGGGVSAGVRVFCQVQQQREHACNYVSLASTPLPFLVTLPFPPPFRPSPRGTRRVIQQNHPLTWALGVLASKELRLPRHPRAAGGDEALVVEDVEAGGGLLRGQPVLDQRCREGNGGTMIMGVIRG